MRILLAGAMRLVVHPPFSVVYVDISSDMHFSWSVSDQKMAKYVLRDWYDFVQEEY